jgi:hypothetical protein
MVSDGLLGKLVKRGRDQDDNEKNVRGILLYLDE